VFCFFFFLKNSRKRGLMSNLFRLLTLLMLLICAFLSQERLQILSILVSIFVTQMIRAINYLRKSYIVKINLRKLAAFSISILFVVGSIYYLSKIDYLRSYFEYYQKYRIASLLTGNQFIGDQSLNIRIEQFNIILFSNHGVLGLVLGNGLGSTYKISTGNNYIVDSVWLWILKDIGTIGIFILYLVYFRIFSLISSIKFQTYAFIAGIVSVSFLMLFIPNFLISINDSFAFGYLLGLIELFSISQKNTVIDGNNLVMA